PEPIQVDSTRLTRIGRNRHLSSELCFYCGNNDHFICNCPVKPPRPVVSNIQSEVEINDLTQIPVTLHTSERSISVSALIDSSPFITLQVGLFHKEDLRFLYRHPRLLPEPGQPSPAGPPETLRAQPLPKVGEISCTNGPGQSPSHTGMAHTQHSEGTTTFPRILKLLSPIHPELQYDYCSADLRGKPKHLIWNPAAHEAFQQLKTIFCTTPLLRHPDPDLHFTVEVDASTTEVGAVLSQAVGKPPLLHPCAFLPRKLSPVEQNCDVGNRELLAIKLALEEWHHWLEGATHQFSIITDHKNLQNLREAKGLNPRQARFPPTLQLNLKLFYHLTTSVTSLGSGHSGSRWTLSLLQAQYWWPSMHRDITRYVQSCPVCAMSNTPHHLPAGKLVPLPIPQRPWSHIGVDYITDLPNSEGNTCILVTVDRFS
ncbi:hypothetical protein M9458_055792, partial [Cirrhinus mrigala]